MKNLVIQTALLLFAFTICSFQTPNPTIQEVFQEALNINTLVEQLAKDTNNELLPLTIATNGLVAENLTIKLDGKNVTIINSSAYLTANKASILELKELKMKRKKSFLAFQYGEKIIRVRLKREAGDWVAKLITVKWGNGFNTKIVASSSVHF